MAANKRVGSAEALRQSMLALIDKGNANGARSKVKCLLSSDRT
jgi:hypothetical protein